jgi:DNA-binding NarL/FixJ family response regulator
MTPPSKTRPRVLIADDHPDMVKAIARLLAIDCDVVGTVTDGQAVVEAAHELQPDIIVIDLNLPTVSGFEACRQITQANPAAKVVMFTAMNDPLLRERSFAMGAQAFVCKVASDGDLLSAVQCLCDEGP